MNLKDKLAHLPTEPGCYLMQDSKGDIIYVGKAKNLKNRVKSYFTGAHNEKTTRLVSEIRDFSYVLTNSERESLILEMNLIKQYLPKYNIRLVDDKMYPYIEITDEEHPKLQVIRQRDLKGKVFGPYPNVYAARETVNLLNRLYPLRKCETLPNKACLYYHIGQCLGPCIHKDVDYGDTVSDIEKFLKGDTKHVLKRLYEEMESASEQMIYEKAIEFRDMIMHIEQTTEKQIINLNDFKDRDAIGFAYNQDDIALQILMIRSGKMVDQHQVVYAYVDDPMESIMTYLSQFYEEKMPDELLFFDKFDSDLLTETFGKHAIIPQKGDKKKVVDMAVKNAEHDLEHYFMLYRHKEENKQKALDDLSDLIKKEIKKIDVFDNAQLFGTAPISALIVYHNHAFDKSSYRKYHLKSTTNDDYQAMKEVTYRRYQKMIMEEEKLPDLVLVDGGKGQIHAAEEVLKALELNIPIAGLKKNKRHQLESLIYLEEEILLIRQSELYKLLVKISDEVHRFAIDFHRKTRAKKAVSSPLDQIKGIGPARKKMLLNHFKSIDDLRNASVEELKSLGLNDEIIKRMKEVIL
ncbi:MAG: excinuclease ABC subunit UvrC [Acholeplasmataceae bacterium]|nr:excinuclease ABC subunit UvrC [Acholeplasmataceae bacterium]